MRTKTVIQGFSSDLVLLTLTFLLALLVLVLSDEVFAKMYEEPRSFSLKDKSQEKVHVEVLPKVDTKLLLEEGRTRDKDPNRPGPLRFAVAINVAFDLNNISKWEALADGRLWRLRIQSPGAKSLNLGITRFDMPDGAKLWIYDPEHKHVEGPYTSRDRSHRGSLWTPVIKGEEIVVELFVPADVSLPVVEIGKVNHGYRDFEKSVPGGGTEQSCERDVICPEGDPWRHEIRAVGLYHADGMWLCTGTRLNNPYRKSYFLSANHCNVTGGTNGNDHTLVVYWNYQSATCDMHDPPPITDTQVGGSIYRAGNDASDFLLLELSAEVDPHFNVYRAGWDASGTAPPAAVGIHHPDGDVKAISLSVSSPPDATAWLSPTHDPSGNYWRVIWALGVTEGGSSGSCLFATDTKRCIGQLRGGNSVCGGPDFDDWYGRLSASWTGGGTTDTRLSDWLDPGNTGILGMNGEPHITTVNGVHYDFQGAGEFVALRDEGRLEIQTRHAPIATTSNPGPDPHDGLATCVSFTTAFAARVGKRRITYATNMSKPNTSAVPDPDSLELRVDGILTALGPKAIDLGNGGRIAKTTAPGGLEIDFPDKSILFVTPGRKVAQSYLNLDLIRAPAMDASPDSFRTSGTGGIMGAIVPGDWLPALPDGTSMGPMPASLHQRYSDLYQKFADAWRITDKSSLFDYAPGTSTDTFTMRGWPPEKPPCAIPEAIPVQPASQAVAQDACEQVTAKNMHADCVFDVMATGDTGFAKTYLLSQRIRDRSTITKLSSTKNLTKFEESITFTAAVARTTWTDKSIPTGTVQLTLDGQDVGQAIHLDAKGRGTWTTSSLKPGKHEVSATYTPSQGSAFLASTSFHYIQTVVVGENN